MRMQVSLSHVALFMATFPLSGALHGIYHIVAGASDAMIYRLRVMFCIIYNDNRSCVRVQCIHLNASDRSFVLEVYI